jgi:hypothetical protein
VKMSTVKRPAAGRRVKVGVSGTCSLVQSALHTIATGSWKS